MSEKVKRPSATEELVEAGQEFYRRGWALAASGSFSVLMARKPMRLCITSAGNEKGTLDDTNFLELDDDAEILHGFGRPSNETFIHLTIYRLRPKARCILFSNSVAGTIVADANFVDGAIKFKGYEVLKGLSGVETHEHSETVPIVENSQDHLALSHVVDNVLLENKNIHGIYVRRHGLYTWGETVAEARRHVEIFEFLFEVLERTRARSWK